MKKKTLSCALACAMILPCAAVGLAACGGGEDSKPKNKINYNIKMTIADYDSSMFDMFNGESVSFTTKDWYSESENDHFTDAVRSKDGTAAGPGKTDIRFNILINKKYFPDSIVVTEKSGKSFVKSSEMAEETGAQHNLLVLTIPYASTIDYDFTVTCPTPVIKKLPIDIPDAALTSDDPVVKDVLQNTKLFVMDENGKSEFVNIAKRDASQNKLVSNLVGKHIAMDMSKKPIVYATFDSDPRRIRYDNVGKIFGIDYTKNTVPYRAMCLNIDYEETVADGIYGYGLEFDEDVADDANAKLVFLKDNFGSGDKVHYVESTVNKSFTAYTVSNEHIKHQYMFELAEYRENDGAWTPAPAGSIEKKYGSQYELKYKLIDTEALFYEDVFGFRKNDARTDALKADTDYTQIKLALNGKSFDGDSTVYAEEGGVHYYTVKLGAEEIPYDFDGVAIKKESDVTNDRFNANADVSSIKISGTSVNVKLPNEFSYNGAVNYETPYEFSRYETPDYFVTRQTVDGTTKTFNFRAAAEIAALKKFTLNVKLNGQTYSRSFQVGVDYLKSLSDKPEGFENLDLVELDIGDYSYMPSFWTYLLGSADNTDADYIACYFGASSGGGIGVDVILNATGLDGSNDIEIYLTDVERRPVTIERAGVAVDENSLKVREYAGQDKGNDVYVPVSGNELYPYTKYNIDISGKEVSGQYVEYTFVMELYAGDKLIATIDKNSSMDGITPSNNVPSGRKIDGINTYGISSMGEDGGNGMTGINFDFKLPLGLYDAEHNSVYIMFDKIVIRVSEHVPEHEPKS